MDEESLMFRLIFEAENNIEAGVTSANESLGTTEVVADATAKAVEKVELAFQALLATARGDLRKAMDELSMGVKTQAGDLDGLSASAAAYRAELIALTEAQRTAKAEAARQVIATTAPRAVASDAYTTLKTDAIVSAEQALNAMRLAEVQSAADTQALRTEYERLSGEAREFALAESRVEASLASTSATAETAAAAADKVTLAFKELQTLAGSTLRSAMDALSLAIHRNEGDLGQLSLAAASARAEVIALAEAERSASVAAASQVRATSAPRAVASDAYSTLKTDAYTSAEQALNRLHLAEVQNATDTQVLRAEYEDLAAKAEVFARAEATIEASLARSTVAVETQSTALKQLETASVQMGNLVTAADRALADAKARVTLAILDEGQASEELVARGAEMVAAKERLVTAEREAAIAIGQTTEAELQQATAASEITERQTMAANAVAEAKARIAMAYLSGLAAEEADIEAGRASMGTAAGIAAAMDAATKAILGNTAATDENAAAQKRAGVTESEFDAMLRQAALDAKITGDALRASMANGQEGAVGLIAAAKEAQLELARLNDIRVQSIALATGDAEATTREGVAFKAAGDAARIGAEGLNGWNAGIIISKGNLAIFGAALAVLAGKEFVDYQQELQVVAGNTGMLGNQVQWLNAQVQHLGENNPQPLADIATSIRHASDESYRFAAGITVVKAGLEGAAATGASGPDVVNSLATAMHNFHEPAFRAKEDMSALMTASQMGNVTLEQLTTNMSKLAPLASAIGMPLSDVVALEGAFTKATGNASQAQTFGVNILTHIIGPTQSALKLMDDLKQKTGVDLPKAFEQFSQGQMSFYDVMSKVREATQGSNADVMKLFGGIRGGVGGLEQFNGGLQEYFKIAEAARQKTKELDQQHAQASQTLGYQIGILRNLGVEWLQALGQDVVPALKMLEGELSPILHLFDAFVRTDGDVVGALVKLGLELGELKLAMKALEIAGLDGFMATFAADITKVGSAAAAATPELVGFDGAEAKAGTAGIAGAAGGALGGAAALGGTKGGATPTGKPFDPAATTSQNLARISGGPEATGGEGMSPSLGWLGVAITAYQTLTNWSGKEEAQSKLTAAAHTRENALIKEGVSAKLAHAAASSELQQAEDKLRGGIIFSNKAIEQQVNDAVAVIEYQKQLGHQIDYTSSSLERQRVAWAKLLDTQPGKKTIGQMAGDPSFFSKNDKQGAPQPSSVSAADAQKEYQTLTKQYQEALYTEAANAIKNHGVALEVDKDKVEKLGARIAEWDKYLQQSGDSLAQLKKAGDPLAVAQQDLAKATVLANQDVMRDGSVLPEHAKRVQLDSAEIAKMTKAVAALTAPTDALSVAQKQQSDAALAVQADYKNLGRILPEHAAAYLKATNTVNGLQAAVSNIIANAEYVKYGSRENAVSGNIEELRHQSAMIGLSTSLTSEEKAVQQAQLQVQIDLKQIALDQLKETQIKNEHGSKAQVAAAQSVVTGDISKLGEDQGALGVAQTAQTNKTLQDGFAASEQAYANQIDILNHQSSMIDLDTSLSSEQRDVAKAALALQIAQKQLAEDGVKFLAVLATPGHTRAEVLAAQGAITGDKGNIQAAQKTLGNAQEAEAATHFTVEWTKKQGDASQKATEALSKLEIGIAKGDTPQQLAVLAKRADLAAGALARIDDIAKRTPLVIGTQTGVLPDRLKAAQDLLALDTERLAEKQYDLAHGIKDGLPSLATLRKEVDDDTTSMHGLRHAIDLITNGPQPNFDHWHKITNPFLSNIPGTPENTARQNLGIGGVPSLGIPPVTIGQIQASNPMNEINADIALGKMPEAINAASSALLAGKITIDQYNGVLAQTADYTKKEAVNGIALAKANHDTVGELNTALDAYHKGYIGLDQLTAAYNDNAAAVKKTTEQDNAYLEHTGQYGALQQSLTSQDTQDGADALGKLFVLYREHGQVTQEDINAAREHTRAIKADSDAAWKASYATASDHDRRDMLIQTIGQPLVSDQSSQQGTHAALLQASDAQIAAASAQQVALLQEIATELADNAAIAQAQGSVGTAQFNKQLSAINDASALEQAIASAKLATDTTLQTIKDDIKSGDTAKQTLDTQLLEAQKKVGADEVAIARTTMEMDQATADAQIKVAQDGVKQATDKLHVDQANAEANAKVQLDQLKVAGDNYNIQLAQAKVQADILSAIDDQNAAYGIGDGEAYAKTLNADLTTLTNYQNQGLADQSQLGLDTGAANQTAAQGQILLGQDASQTAADSLSATSIQQIYQLELAKEKAQEAHDQILAQTYQQQISALQDNTKAQQDANDSATLLAVIAALESVVHALRLPASAHVRGSSVQAQSDALAGRVRSTV